MEEIKENEWIKCYVCDNMIESEDHPYYCAVLRLILRNEDDMRKYQSLCDGHVPVHDLTELVE